MKIYAKLMIILCKDNCNRTEKQKAKAWLLGLNEQNAEAYSVFFHENSALKKELKYYHSQHNTLERRVKILERGVGSLKVELEDLESSSFESSSSDSDIDEIVKMIKY
jgi:hypothetical protein